jgi:AraC-like DNA-binding protein
MEHDVLIPVGYAEHAPPADLASRIACVWTHLVTPPAPGDRQSMLRVLPDGCVDIILGFSRGDASIGDGASEMMAVGAMTRPLMVPERGPQLRIGVRFRPGHAFAALGAPAAELTDERVSYDLLANDADEALDDIAVQSTNEARLQAIVRLVRRRLTGAPAVPASVRRAVQIIAAEHGNLRVAALTSAIGITRQQLARQFATHVGITPKTFARVMRTRAALARADAARAAHPRDVDWTAIAYDLGYYDQPHFIDEFKSITGATPGQWTKSRASFAV